MLGKRRRSDSPGFIKPHTQGTSNEISFDVLDKKRNAADDPTPPAWEFSHAEVEKRKKKRVRNKRLFVTMIVVITVAVCLFLGMLVWSQLHNQMDNIQQLRQALTQVQEEDQLLDPFKEVVTNSLSLPLDQLNEETEAEYKAANSTASAVSSQNAEIKRRLESLQATLQAADLEASNQGIAAINADHNAVELGRTIMSYVQSAIDGYAQADSAFQSMMTADSLARESAALMESQTIEGANQSIAKSNECIAEFNRAKAALQKASDAYEEFPKADPLKNSGNIHPINSDSATTSENASANEDSPSSANPIKPFIEYVDLRIQAQHSAIESTQAYIDRNKETLVQANDTYNSLEVQAADLVSKQPNYPAEALGQAYAEACKTQSDQWEAEVARATAAIKAVRDYLG